MIARFLRRTRRIAATALAAANLPRPPRRPATVAGDWGYLKAHMRWYIRRSLRKSGWKLVESEGYKYWSMRRFERG